MRLGWSASELAGSACVVRPAPFPSAYPCTFFVYTSCVPASSCPFSSPISSPRLSHNTQVHSRGHVTVHAAVIGSMCRLHGTVRCKVLHRERGLGRTRRGPSAMVASPGRHGTWPAAPLYTHVVVVPSFPFPLPAQVFPLLSSSVVVSTGDDLLACGPKHDRVLVLGGVRAADVTQGWVGLRCDTHPRHTNKNKARGWDKSQVDGAPRPTFTTSPAHIHTKLRVASAALLHVPQ
jgi:hypothetical protein